MTIDLSLLKGMKYEEREPLKTCPYCFTLFGQECNNTHFDGEDFWHMNCWKEYNEKIRKINKKRNKY